MCIINSPMRILLLNSNIMYAIGSVCFVVAFYFVTKIIKKILHVSRSLEPIPGPPPSIFFGNALDFLGDKGMIAVFQEYTKNYGHIMKSQFGPAFFGLLVSDGEFTKQVLLRNTNLSKGRIYDLTKCWLGEGLLTSDEYKWRNQRKMLTHAFSNKIIMDFVATFDQQAHVLTDKVEKLIPLESVDIHEFLSLCSLDIICEAAMGVSINAQKNEDSEYVICVRDMCKVIANRSMQIWKFFEPLFWFSSDYRKQKRSLKVIKNHVNKVITIRKQQRATKRERRLSTEESGEFDKDRKLALLDVLLEYSENEEYLHEKEIEDEVHTFMFAGHDTTTATMDFVIYELARNPEIQNLAYQEQKEIFGDDLQRQTNFSDIHEMKYLDMVIKETLRLYPPVCVIARHIDEEFKFRDYIIPEGVSILFFIYELHRNAELFPNPDIFDPSRFESSDAVMPFSFIPFSTGPRNCIGQKFAMFEMKVIISRLLRKFEFVSTVPEHILDLRAEVVLTSRNGVKVGIVQRGQS